MSPTNNPPTEPPSDPVDDYRPIQLPSPEELASTPFFVPTPSDPARTAAESTRIYTKCPACHNDTLTVCDKHLLCTWHVCPDPTLIHRIDEMTAALRREVEELRAERDKARDLGSHFYDKALELVDKLTTTEIARDTALASLAAVTNERDEAVAFASKVERGEVRFYRQVDEQMQRIASLPLGKTIHEGIADAVTRVLTERDAALASAEAGAKDTALITAAESGKWTLAPYGENGWAVTIPWRVTTKQLGYGKTLRAAIAAATEGESHE